MGNKRKISLEEPIADIRWLNGVTVTPSGVHDTTRQEWREANAREREQDNINRFTGNIRNAMNTSGERVFDAMSFIPLPTSIGATGYLLNKGINFVNKARKSVKLLNSTNNFFNSVNNIIPDITDYTIKNNAKRSLENYLQKTIKLLPQGNYLGSNPMSYDISSNREFAKRFNRVLKKYGYDTVPLDNLDYSNASKFNEQIQEKIKSLNRYVRGVKPNSYEESILPENELDEILKKYATEFAPSTGRGRSGTTKSLLEKLNLGTLYTSNSYGTGFGYATPMHRGEYKGKVALLEYPTVFNNNRNDWILNNMPQFSGNGVPTKNYKPKASSILNYAKDYSTLIGSDISKKISMKQDFPKYKDIFMSRNINSIGNDSRITSFIDKKPSDYLKEYMDLNENSPFGGWMTNPEEIKNIENFGKVMDNFHKKVIKFYDSLNFQYGPSGREYVNKYFNSTIYPLLYFRNINEKNGAYKNIATINKILHNFDINAVKKDIEKHAYKRIIKKSINRPTEQVKLLEELYPDIYYKAISNKHNIGNRNIIQMFGDNSGSHKTKSLPASYQHFNFIGPVGQKGLNFIGWINPTENVEKYLTRQHIGTYTKGLSRKTNKYGGRKSLKNI